MNVTVAQSAGFCWGVRRAVDIACRTAKEAKQTIFTDGPLIHNSHMMKELEASGVSQCADPATLPPCAHLVIRAHGIPPERRTMLEALPISCYDATCPDVAKIQRIIQKNAEEGRTILVLGDHGHAEVVGLLGYAGSGGRVITSPQDVDKLSTDIADVCFVSQSTQPEKAFLEVADAILKRWPNATIVNTICRATRNRQAELKTLAESCDVFVIVGSPASANTQRLAQLAAELKPTHVVDSAEELNPADFINIENVAVSAGASTPDFMIEAVTARLKSF